MGPEETLFIEAKNRVDRWVSSVRRVVRTTVPGSSLSPSIATETALRQENLALAIDLKKEASTLIVNLSRTRLFSDLRRTIKDAKKRMWALSSEVQQQASNSFISDNETTSMPQQWQPLSSGFQPFPFQTFRPSTLLSSDQQRHSPPSSSTVVPRIGIPSTQSSTTAYPFPLFGPPMTSYDFNATITASAAATGFFPNHGNASIYPHPMFLINRSTSSIPAPTLRPEEIGASAAPSTAVATTANGSSSPDGVLLKSHASLPSDLAAREPEEISTLSISSSVDSEIT